MFPVSFLDVGITSLFHLFVESLLTSYLLFKFLLVELMSVSLKVFHMVLAVHSVSLNISVRSLRRFIISNLMEFQSALLYKGMLRGVWRCMTCLKSNSE